MRPENDCTSLTRPPPRRIAIMSVFPAAIGLLVERANPTSPRYTAPPRSMGLLIGLLIWAGNIRLVFAVRGDVVATNRFIL